MKIIAPSTWRHRFLSLALVGSLTGIALAAPSAFDLIKEGNRFIGEQAKDKVVEIRAEKSVGGLTPQVWYVVYHDSTATLKAVEVKFVAGKMAEVKRPARLLEPLARKDQPLDREKLKIDSDRAIKIATADPIVDKITVTATAPKLERGDAGPVWKVRLWAAKLKEPSKDVDIGEIIVAADTGTVLKNDVNLKRVD